jgi:extracellular factor (EF) 3-hydroxypalmitic acid methyl ester biosynthesis protein
MLSSQKNLEQAGVGSTAFMGCFDEFARALKTNHCDPFATVKTLMDGLGQERALHPKRWLEFSRSCREHELHSLLLQDPLTNRAFIKPRGYAGDAVMLDFVYGHQDAQELVVRSPETGQRILAYTGGGSPAARAVRWRCARAAQEIEAVAVRHPKARVLAFACGHLREVGLVHPELRRRIQITAADIDEESLRMVANAYGRDCRLECRRISVRDVILSKHGLDPGFDLIYALGLFDYLTDKVAERLVPILWSLLAPEGKLMLANFTPEADDAAYMEAITDWWLQYRSVEALRAWTALVENQTIASHESFHDPLGQVAYLLLGKRGLHEPAASTFAV